MANITDDDSTAPATKADIRLVLDKLSNFPTREEMKEGFDRVPTREEMNERFDDVPTRKEMKIRFDDIDRQLKNLGEYVTTILNNLVAHHERIIRIEKELQLV